MGLGIRPFTPGLHDVGNHCYAWIQPDGGWGWSNAGLIVDGGESLLVDTLFDLKLTRAMLEGMRAAEPNATRAFDKLVNTHANADYDSWGDAERIAVNVATLYREFGASPTPANPLGAFEAMAKIRKARGQAV